MKTEIKTLPKSQIQLTITVSPADYEPFLDKAASRLSQTMTIKGFRPGKAPLEKIKQAAGEMAILNEALEDIVQSSFYESVQKEKLETIGMPQIKVDKIAPGNDLVYTATVATLPQIKLPDLKKIKVEKTVKTIGEKDVEETISALRGMRAQEILKAGPAESTDKLVIDMDMFIDKVPVDGGQAKDYQVYLSENHYIPGFNDQVKGLSANEEKEFSLDFPPTHYQKNLAGKKVDFKVKVKSVFERQLPELNEDLAKKLGQESVTKLQELVRNNLQEEANLRSEQKLEAEILDQLIEKTEFNDLPDVLIDAERQKMYYELKTDLDKHGVDITDYLRDLKKTPEQMYEDFRTQAEKRARAALLSRQIAEENNLDVPKEELEKEIKGMEEIYKDNPEYLERLKRTEVKSVIASTLQNRKVMDWLKKQLISQ
ncbi:MAG TPA: trigger factor [Patescibacteria group bacterium]|nr:trigger factor [Patescibacteria group bacterium]